MCGWGVGGRGWGEERRLVCEHMLHIPMHMIVYSLHACERPLCFVTSFGL